MIGVVCYYALMCTLIHLTPNTQGLLYYKLGLLIRDRQSNKYTYVVLFYALVEIMLL